LKTKGQVKLVCTAYSASLVPIGEYSHLVFLAVTGEVSEKGFCKYEGKKKENPDPEITKYVEESRRIAGATADPEVWSRLTVFLLAFLFALTIAI
jgi:hypothetical protein